MNNVSNNIFAINENLIQSAMIQSRNANYKFPLHAHETMELYLIKEGSCSMKIQSSQIIAKKGDIILILPFAPHTFQTNDEKCVFAHLHIHVKPLKSIFYRDEDNIFSFHTLLTSQASFYRYQETSHITYLIYTIIKIFNSDSIYNQIYRNLHAVELLTILLEHGMAQPFIKQQLSKTKYKYISFTYEYIHEHYANKLLIDDIASSLHISSRYLSSVFYEATNQTILQYLNGYRINKAIELMANTNKSLTEIALSIGLNNAQHFSKLFHTIIGETPSAYRKLLNRKE